jgi:hypothetical protein
MTRRRRLPRQLREIAGVWKYAASKLGDIALGFRGMGCSRSGILSESLLKTGSRGRPGMGRAAPPTRSYSERVGNHM